MAEHEKITITSHARRRAYDRYDHRIAHALEDIAAHARRKKYTTKDGLRLYKGRYLGDPVYLLCLEKTGAVCGLFEIEVITVLSHEQARRDGLA